MDQIIKMSNIHKHFGSTKALNGVDFHLFPGEIVGLLGENGAGKTTLMNVLYGLVEADKGNIHFFGKEINIHSHSPAQSLKFGLSMVHQHFMLVNRLTVAENLIIGKEPTKIGFTDINKAVEDVLAQHFSLDDVALTDELRSKVVAACREVASQSGG